MLIPLLWWTLVLGPFVYLAIFDAIYDSENYSVRVNPYYAMTGTNPLFDLKLKMTIEKYLMLYLLLYLVSATIVVCYGIAVICYQFARKSAKNRYTPEAADILDTPEIDDPYIETNDNENNLVAYV